MFHRRTTQVGIKYLLLRIPQFLVSELSVIRYSYSNSICIWLSNLCLSGVPVRQVNVVAEDCGGIVS